MDKDELRIKILRLIQENPFISQRQISREVGASLGYVNYCLKALVEIGWIKAGNFAKSGRKLGYLYMLTPRGIKEKTRMTTRFLTKKRCEYEALCTEIKRLESELEESSEGTSYNDN